MDTVHAPWLCGARHAPQLGQAAGFAPCPGGAGLGWAFRLPQCHDDLGLASLHRRAPQIHVFSGQAHWSGDAGGCVQQLGGGGLASLSGREVGWAPKLPEFSSQPSWLDGSGDYVQHLRGVTGLLPCLGGAIKWAPQPVQPMSWGCKWGTSADETLWQDRATNPALQLGRIFSWPLCSGATPQPVCSQPG